MEKTNEEKDLREENENLRKENERLEWKAIL